MNLPSKRAAITAAGLLIAVGGAIVNDYIRHGQQAAVDPVVAAFEREFAREPGPPARIRRESIDDDVLYQTINSIHWTTYDQPIESVETITSRSHHESEEN